MSERMRDGHKQKRLPRTFEAAVKRAVEYQGRILWPPIAESVQMLDEQFPHLRGVLGTQHKRNPKGASC